MNRDQGPPPPAPLPYILCYIFVDLIEVGNSVDKDCICYFMMFSLYFDSVCDWYLWIYSEQHIYICRTVS